MGGPADRARGDRRGAGPSRRRAPVRAIADAFAALTQPDAERDRLHLLVVVTTNPHGSLEPADLRVGGPLIWPWRGEGHPHTRAATGATGPGATGLLTHLGFLTSLVKSCWNCAPRGRCGTLIVAFADNVDFRNDIVSYRKEIGQEFDVNNGVLGIQDFSTPDCGTPSKSPATS